MPDKKLRIDDDVHIETHSQIRYDAAGEQRHQDGKLYVREKNMLETGSVYFIIAVGTLVGIFIYMRIQSYHGKREKQMISAIAQRKENEKKRNSHISEINALRNAISEIKSSDIIKYSSTEISESEATVLEAEVELKKFNFVKVTELTKKTKDKLDEATNKAKHLKEKDKKKNLAKQKELIKKQRIAEEKQKQAENKKIALENKRKKEEALKQLKEIEKMMKQ